MKNIFVNSIGMLLCGLSLGWLVGMSTTPTIHNIITTLFTFVMTIMGLIAGIELKAGNKLGDYLNQINLIPIGLFFICLSFGSAVGVYTRTNELLGLNPTNYMAKWKIQDNKIDSLRADIKRDSTKLSNLYAATVSGDDSYFKNK